MKWWSHHGGKRLFDLLLSLGGLLVFLLPLAWIAFRIRRESGAPILFRQVRVGRGGGRFLLWKFRTMTPDGRITPFGEKLRRTAMDELPQLLNILRGEMSFVGPRPLIPGELVELDRIPEGRRRLEPRPGLAGLAQLRAAKVPQLDERVSWDLVYADRCSMTLDLGILLRSVGVTCRSGWEGTGPKMKESRK